MILRSSILVALYSAMALSSAFAQDPIYVVRPPVMQMKAKVLPQNAFSASAPAGPSTPSAPSNSGYVFKSRTWDTPAYAPGEAIIRSTIDKATISLSRDTAYIYSTLPNGACNISESTTGASTKKIDVMIVPGWPYSTLDERTIRPKVTGQLALAFYCDAVNNLPGSDLRSRYYGRLLLTVTP
jgi:hypothetical protein